MLCKQINQLKLLQWNAQGATTQSVIAQIDYTLNKHNIDIAFIAETFLSSSHEIEFTNFTSHRSDRNSHGGGVLIAVRNNIEYKCLPNYKTSLAENISIEISIDKKRMVFTAAYIPKYTASFASDINKITPENKNFITLGDFNAKHVAWNCSTNNRAGKVLYNMLNNSNFVIHHPNTHTHFPHCGNRPSTIDFALTNSPLLFTNIYTLENALPSDHHPVICTVEGFAIEHKASTKPDYRRANWKKFSSRDR